MTLSRIDAFIHGEANGTDYSILILSSADRGTIFFIAFVPPYEEVSYPSATNTGSFQWDFTSTTITYETIAAVTDGEQNFYHFYKRTSSYSERLWFEKHVHGGNNPVEW